MTKITYQLQEFEGPLDLLLKMIQSEELDITEVSLAMVADQFVQYIESHPEISGHEISDFLVVATQLLLIKSKLLLPHIELEEEVSTESLQTQLKLYRRFIDAAERLQARIDQKQFLYHRTKSPYQSEPRFSAPEGTTVELMKQRMLDVIKRLEPIVILSESVIERTVTLHEKMVDIQKLLKSRKGLSFKSLLSESASKMEQIVSFLALLELVKQEEVIVTQSGAFDDIQISKN